MSKFCSMKSILIIYLLGLFNVVYAQVKEAPLISEGGGPYEQLIIRGVSIIDGTGAPPRGPVDVVIEKDKIVNIKSVGYPGVEIDSTRRPKLKEGGIEIDADGKFLLPGFVDMHGHIGGKYQGADAEYVFKLWMGHGITTIRDPSCGNGLDWTLKHKQLSDQNKITAPRIEAYTVFGQDSKDPISTPDMARQWVRDNANKGADGIKFFGLAPKIFDAALRENKN